MFCGKCGQQLEDNVSFCVHCGTKISGSTALTLKEELPITEFKQKKSFYETKSMDIPTETEGYITALMQDFGWQVKSSQRIYSKDSHLERDISGDIVSITETTDFVRIVFMRDQAMHHYDELKELYDKYEKAAPIELKSHVDIGPNVFEVLGVIVGFIFYIVPGVIYVRQLMKRKEERIAENKEIDIFNAKAQEENPKRLQLRENLRQQARLISKI